VKPGDEDPLKATRRVSSQQLAFGEPPPSALRDQFNGSIFAKFCDVAEGEPCWSCAVWAELRRVTGLFVQSTPRRRQHTVSRRTSR
jgi:hypothetical protein